MKELSNINIQPITFFEVKGLFFISVFPTIFQGITMVLCGKSKNGKDILVVHDCNICKGYGHEECPYVREGMKYYQHHTDNFLPSYQILQRQVNPSLKWKQLSKEEMAELLEKVSKSDYKTTTRYIGDC